MVRDQSGGTLAIEGASQHTEKDRTGQLALQRTPLLCASVSTSVKWVYLEYLLVEVQGLNETMRLKVLVWRPGAEQALLSGSGGGCYYSYH